MAKLTKAQSRALQEISSRDGILTAWCVGTRTAEALRSRGLVRPTVETGHPFGGRWGYDPCLWITDAGRAALTNQNTGG